MDKKTHYAAFVMLNSDQIRKFAPQGAAYYKLTMQLSNEMCRVYPSEQGEFFRVGESPFGVPVGTYSVSYYDENYVPLLHSETSVQISFDLQHQQTKQIALSMEGASGSNLVYARSNGVVVPQHSEILPVETQKARYANSMDEADPEFRRYLYAMDLEDRQQEFIKNAGYVQEVGESFTMNRILRRELIEMQRIVILSSQQAYKDVEQIKSTVHTLLQLQKDIVESAKEIPRPAPPPPDYVGLGHSALAMLKDIGVALVHRSHRPDETVIEGRSAVAQLPAARVPSEETKVAPPSDALGRAISKLKGLSELEIAACMSSPESWKALLDECRAPATQPQSQPSEAKPSPTIHEERP